MTGHAYRIILLTRVFHIKFTKLRDNIEIYKKIAFENRIYVKFV